MKKFVGAVVIIFSAASLLPGDVFSAESLYSSLSSRGAVKIYVREIADATTDHKVNVQDLKEKLEKALAERKSVRFKVVPSKGEADLELGAELKSFYWTDHDPVDMLIGAGAAAMDALTVEDYARLEGNLEVLDARTGRVLWKETVLATLTKKDMPAEKSVTLINDEMAKNFIHRAFGKTRDRH